MHILVEKATGIILGLNKVFMLEELMEADGLTEVTHGIYPVSDAEVEQVREGMDYTLNEFKDGSLAPSVEGHANKVRHERMEKLFSDVDPIVMNSLRWGDLSPAEKAALSVYRQELLDVPQQAGFPKTHVWPNKP